jgi:replicative superfamily II helicase
MIGRSGRVGLDPQGDAYILLPESKMDIHKNRLKVPPRIESQLLSKEAITTRSWPSIWSARFTTDTSRPTTTFTTGTSGPWPRSKTRLWTILLLTRTMDLLKKVGAIWEENSEYSATTVGQVASMFYFSPFDVSDLKKNFNDLFANKNQDNDYWLSMALGNIDGQRMNIVSKAEKDEMSMYHTKVRELLGTRFYNDAAVKAGFCYFQLLNGNNSGVLSAMQRNLPVRLQPVVSGSNCVGFNGL